MVTKANAVGNSLSGQTGTGQFVGDTSPTIATLTTTGDLIATGVSGVTTGSPVYATVDSVSGQLGSSTVQLTSSTKITTFGAGAGTYTWTKSTNPPTKWIEVYMWGGGGGGGSGRQGTAEMSGGGGGGAFGTILHETFPAYLFNSTETVLIGAGGSGGISQTSIDTGGLIGTTGNPSSIGYITSPGGIGGNGGSTGAAAPGTGFTLYNSSKLGYSGSGGSGLITNGSSISQSYNTAAYFSKNTLGGGGAGASAITPYQGGTGGSIKDPSDTNVILAGGTGGISSGTINGSNGLPYVTSSSTAHGVFGGGSAGGGGGGQYLASAAGTGGNGGLGGGGGGGGGGSIDLTNSGAGGNGGDGLLIVIEYF